MSSPWRRRLLAALFLGAAIFLGSFTQQRAGITFSLEQLEDFRLWVQGLGWWGPAVFVILMIFRLFLGLSSHLVLIVGGVVFGAVGGIVWGSIGLVLSSLVLYFLASGLGADWVERRFGDRYTRLLERVERIGAVAILAITAHPFGVLTPAHLAAGLIGLPAGRFAVAVAIAAPLRAAPYAFLGTAILDLTLAQSLTIAAAMLLVFVAPLAHPRFRQWVWGEQSGSSAANDASPQPTPPDPPTAR